MFEAFLKSNLDGLVCPQNKQIKNFSKILIDMVGVAKSPTYLWFFRKKGVTRCPISVRHRGFEQSGEEIG